MLLQEKTAVVYGAGGAVGAAVAWAFAAEGARVALTGRNVESLELVRRKISETGGRADVAAVDAYDQEAVEEHMGRLVGETGRVDISFNAVGLGYVIGDPLTDESCDDFVTLVQRAMQRQFATAIAAGRRMTAAGSGVILTITASPARATSANQGSLGVVGAAIEALCRQLAADLGPQGVRVVCLRSAGSPDAPGVDHAMSLHAEQLGISRQAFEARWAEQTFLKRLPRLAEVGSAAALIASDQASAVTASVMNVTCGGTVD